MSVLSPWIPGLPELAKTSAPLALLSADQERLRFFEGVSQLVICLARVHGPLILFLDDLQWANSSTIDFLDYLSLKISDCPILIFGAYRSDEVTKGHSLSNLLQRAIREGAEGHIYSIQLPNLAEKTIDELLHYTAPKMKDRHRLSRYLKQKSGGNPFFLVSILQSLFETKALRVTPEGHWIADAPTITRSQIKILPREVKEIVEARLERLANEDRHLLEIMSVIGHESRKVLLQRLCRDLMTNSDEIGLMRCLENLEQAQLISAENQSYRFVHDILREVTYQRTSSADRLLWHRHLAEIFEEFHQTDPQPPHGLLAYHYARAGAAQKALEHLLPALKEAVVGYRNEEGLELAAEAWGFTEQLAEQDRKDRAIHQIQFEILTEKIKIYDILGKRQEQEAALTDLFTLTNTLGDEKKLAHAHLMQAKLYLDTARYPLAQAECMKALKIAKSQRDLTIQASSLHFIAIAHYRMSNYDQALAYLEQEHKLRNALGDKKNLAESFRYLALVSWQRDDYEEATKYYREALKMLDDMNYRQDRARILTDMGAMYWVQGNFQKAIETYEEIHRLAVDIGDRRAEAEALRNLGSTWFALGEYERALKFRQQTSDIHYTIGEKRMYGWDLNFVGLVYWSVGQDDLAHQYFEKAQKIAQEVKWKEGKAFALNNIGLLHWRAKKFDKALKLSQEALEIHQNIGTKHELAIVLRNLGEIYCDAGKYSKALEYLDKALFISQTMGSKIEEMQILSDQSATYLKVGKVKKAVACSHQSLKLLKQTRRSPHAPKLLFSHFQALHGAEQTDEALKSLYRAYRALMRRAKRIENSEFRQSFLENVPVNREITEFYRRYFQPLELSEAESYELLCKIRWPKGVISPCCASKQVRVHGQVNRTSEKRYLCMKCRKTFTDRIGTAFANKNLPLSKLLQALVVVSRATDESIATQAITKLGIHAYTAKNLYRKLSSALREDKLLQRLSSELNKKSL